MITPMLSWTNISNWKQQKNDPALFFKNNSIPIIVDEIQRAPELFMQKNQSQPFADSFRKQDSDLSLPPIAIPAIIPAGMNPPFPVFMKVAAPILPNAFAPAIETSDCLFS